MIESVKVELWLKSTLFDLHPVKSAQNRRPSLNTFFICLFYCFFIHLREKYFVRFFWFLSHEQRCLYQNVKKKKRWVFGIEFFWISSLNYFFVKNRDVNRQGEFRHISSNLEVSNSSNFINMILTFDIENIKSLRKTLNQPKSSFLWLFIQ